MTELEVMQRAKLYMDKLAQGIDPVSNREIPEDSVLNQVQLARCFFYVSGVLEQVIAKVGKAEKPAKKRFYLTEEELRRIKPAQEQIRITQLAERIMNAVDDPSRKQPNVTAITDWLLKNEFMQIQVGADGKSKRLPTKAGERIGISSSLRRGRYGTYQTVYYSTEAQRFIVDHLMEILQKK